MPKKKENMEMDWSKHKKKKGYMILILGLLILANTYWKVISWDYFIGIIVALVGLVKLFK